MSVEAAVRRQRGRIGGGIEPERQDTQVSAELTGEACGRIELEAGCTQQRSWPACGPRGEARDSAELNGEGGREKKRESDASAPWNGERR